MTLSRAEEIIAALHWIVAILCFAYGHPVFGWVFILRAATDELAAIVIAWKGVKHARIQ